MLINQTLLNSHADVVIGTVSQMTKTVSGVRHVDIYLMLLAKEAE